MDKKRYQELVNKYTPKENRLYNGLIAFFVGVLLGVLLEKWNLFNNL